MCYVTLDTCVAAGDNTLRYYAFMNAYNMEKDLFPVL